VYGSVIEDFESENYGKPTRKINMYTKYRVGEES